MKIFKLIKIFSKMLWLRINQDRLTTSSASLAYTTILALVPLITVIFSLLSAFPMFDEISLSLKRVIYSNLVPTASDIIQNYLEQFIANTKKMTFFGIIGLIITSLLLINSINTTLNHIWKTKRKRSFMYNLTMYWTILTLGPILAGSSVVVSSYIFSPQWISTAATGNIMLSALPFIISIIGFWLLYSIIPTESVPLKESLIGAIVAAILFELGKRAFALYVSSFPTYQLIYGVVSTIPIMLAWIYCSWCIVLFGAEFAATLTDYNRQKKQMSNNQSLLE
ncbi:hypothetical protein A9G34_03405 [Gilliamella sp. Choc4-2]|jgi:membrane protein|uniref:virulence factor BrkB family protein n=1 Tax=unclassified Gilliamella TaxID=2685620 RepID=UPI0004DD5337|nr:virulence factor BrkB family protein [Gilliamella apicola]KFA58095.1 putative membrane protein [Gilliamella apicola]OCG30795.1 hypothetical protein A9G33_07270 [Gilliamella apicola]OCG47016.1 hypothetical protein A9G34_03405 [Gilliamella apicola]OCG54510.1 hypothetical protein A9G36_08390 [Gilliamella apicola]OCG61941.1 hypothetical protein A9G48_09390 [Gilliamella apicola]